MESTCEKVRGQYRQMILVGWGVHVQKEAKEDTRRFGILYPD